MSAIRTTDIINAKWAEAAARAEVEDYKRHRMSAADYDRIHFSGYLRTSLIPPPHDLHWEQSDLFTPEQNSLFPKDEHAR